MYGFKVLVWDPETGCAISPIGMTVWAGRRAHARCLRPGFAAPRAAPHDAPDRNCDCGIYALSTSLDLIDVVRQPWVGIYDDRLVAALLCASGKVIQCSNGWRAETAEILALSPVPSLEGKAGPVQKEAADVLGVPYCTCTFVAWDIANEHKQLERDLGVGHMKYEVIDLGWGVGPDGRPLWAPRPPVAAPGADAGARGSMVATFMGPE